VRSAEPADRVDSFLAIGTPRLAPVCSLLPLFLSLPILRSVSKCTSATPASFCASSARFSGARASLSVNRKRQNTTAAESSSIKLSPPKAGSAGLREFQAVQRETAASTVLQTMVGT
jgi:hypothetical protein